MARKTISIGKSKITLGDNSKQVQSELNKKIDMILTALGEEWRDIVTDEITVRRIVDTGKLRDSMNYVKDKKNKQIIVGSPVKYAAKQEFENRKGPYLKPSLLNYKETYKKIVEELLKT